ncbi:11647_t:CDS:2 [Funneliformis caledonium]|uniref:11647_t:CDS:1 n=1 Tax=Funneliformis caledonium TaxID=1117310 RepID=A0A9N9CH00_9GLOM|nr:11647_t:CDS:2 [Funneliformis caledonium]
MESKKFTIPPKDMYDYFSSAPFTTRTFIEFLRQLDLEQKLRNLPQFAQDHAKKLLKELSEHDYKLLEQVRNKHVSIGGADVIRVQKEYKVDEELLEASTEKKRKDKDKVTLAPPTKRSSYSPSPSEVEELPSLTTDSVFNEEPITQAQETLENKIVVFSPAFNTIKNVFSPFEYVHRSEQLELEDTKTIPSIIVNEVNEQVIGMMNLVYNVSDGFCKYQISNIDKLVVGETFNFSSNSEAILSLHNIMFIDSTTMKKPPYLDIDDERKWRISIRHPKQ